MVFESGALRDELTGAESGIWHVHTEHSLIVFDLDRRLVERRPGPGRHSLDTDRPRTLLEIRVCRVGERGFWTLAAGNRMSEYDWHYSTIIQRIEEAPDEEGE